LPYNYWTGFLSNDWFDTSNWLLPVIPTTTISAYVPFTVLKPHVTSGNAFANNFVENGGVFLDISNGLKLNVEGDMTINGYITGAGYFSVNGPAAQHFTGATDNIFNLELNNINGLTVNPSFGNTLYVANNYLPTAGVLNTNGAFAVYSDINGTGNIGIGSNGGGYINGNVIMQRYIHQGGGQCELVTNCGEAFRFLGHPFSTSIPLTQLTDDIDITGNGGPTNGFTYTQTNAPSSFWYDPTSPLANGSPINDPGWTAFTSTNGAGANAWNQYEGARVYIRGQKGQALWPQIYIPGAVTLTMAGPVNQGTQTMSLIHNNVSSYNFLSNPYPSNIDMSLTTRGSSIGPNFWTWDPNQGTQGAYVSQPFSTSYILPSGSAFVATTSAVTNNTIQFTESIKVASNATGNLFKTTNGFGNNTVQLRVLSNNDSLSWDRLLLMFDGNAMSQKDELDAVKLYNPSLNFYTYSTDNSQLSIDVRPYASGQVIQLGLQASLAQSYSIRVDDYSVPAGAVLYLHDKYLNQVQQLQQNGHYNFSVTSDPASSGDNRFELNLVGGPLSVNNVVSHGLKVMISPNPASDEASVSFETQEAATTVISVMNLLGQEVFKQSLGVVSRGNAKLDLQNLAAGVYLIKVNSGNESVTERLIKE